MQMCIRDREGTMRKQQQDLATMQQQVADQQLINYELQDQIARVGSDSYIEQQAREDVGLVKDGETRYIVVPNEDADTPAQPTETPAESAAPAESQACLLYTSNGVKVWTISVSTKKTSESPPSTARFA